MTSKFFIAWDGETSEELLRNTAKQLRSRKQGLTKEAVESLCGMLDLFADEIEKKP